MSEKEFKPLDLGEVRKKLIRKYWKEQKYDEKQQIRRDYTIKEILELFEKEVKLRIDTYIDVIVLNLLERLLEIEDIDEFIMQTLEDFELTKHIDKYAKIIDLNLLKKFKTAYFEND